MAYHPFKDLAPVRVVGASPNLLVVDPGLKVDSVKEFVALAKSQPGKLNYGSVGNGSSSHRTMELFKEAAGLDIVHVPHPGSPPVHPATRGRLIAAALIVPAPAKPQGLPGLLSGNAVEASEPAAAMAAIPTWP